MDLRNLLKRFLVSKAAAGLRPRTLAWYEDQIGVYLKWLLAAHLDAASAFVPEVIENYLAEQRQLALKPATVAARYRALSVWCGWLVGRRILAASPLDELERPRVPIIPIEYAEFDEFRRVYAAIDGDDWTSLRDRCILLILFWSGLRVSELTGLATHDVNTTTRLIKVRRGKGGKPRVVPCPPELGPLMLAYLYARPPYDGEALFVGNDGIGGVRGPLLEWGVRLMLRRRCKAAGVRALNPHKFRHGFAMALLNNGMEMSALSKAMGHSSVQITERVYAKWLMEGVSREYEEARARLQTKTRTG